MFDLVQFPGILELLNAPDQALNQLTRYHNLLVDWNRRINLISQNDIPKIWERHFLDSLALTELLDPLGANRILDLGSGAGFPGLPLKIVRPAIKMILLDSVRKKILFLNKVIQTLNIQSIHALLGRAEESAAQTGPVDAVISRGVATAEKMFQWSVPYLGRGGCLILIKGKDGERELESPLIHALSDDRKIHTEFITYNPFRGIVSGKNHHAIKITII